MEALHRLISRGALDRKPEDAKVGYLKERFNDNLMTFLTDEMLEYGTTYEMRLNKAKNMLWEAMEDALGVGSVQPVDGLDKIAEWMVDTKGKGLFIGGDVGRGKTVIAKYVLPAIIAKNKLLPFIGRYDANDLNSDAFEKILDQQYVIIDDVGVETKFNEYGIMNYRFSELVRKYNNEGKFLIITTNLKPTELMERYDLRTMDRVKEMCEGVVFKSANTFRK